MRSGVAQANFLFRAPVAFRPAEEPESPFQVDLSARAGGQKARIRLRISAVAASDLRKDPQTLARARESDYRKRFGSPAGDLRISGRGARARAVLANGMVLLVRDGTRLYELFLEGGATFQAGLRKVADGFTILDPKGGPPLARTTPESLKAKTIEHDYYHLKLLKPAGFSREDVDPDKDRGIWLHLRAEDEVRNLCDIKIRVFLARTAKKSLVERAQAGLDRFARRYLSARVPKRPKRGGWPGAKEAYRLKMAGKMARTGIVVQQDYRFVHHDNGRFYEFELTTYAGAQRAFKKAIAAFWKNLKIRK